MHNIGSHGNEKKWHTRWLNENELVGNLLIWAIRNEAKDNSHDFYLENLEDQ